MLIDPQEIFEFNRKSNYVAEGEENWSRDREWRWLKALQKLEE